MFLKEHGVDLSTVQVKMPTVLPCPSQIDRPTLIWIFFKETLI